MQKRRWFFMWALLFAFSDAPAGNYHVSPSGQDANPGTFEAPFATVDRALRMVREDRRNAPGRPSTLLLSGGEYFLDQPIVLFGNDSDLTIEAIPGTNPVLVGGRPVTGWKRSSNGWYEADLSLLPRVPAYLHLLIVDGQVRPRARLPGTGTFEHETYFTAKWLSSTGGEWGANKPTLQQLTMMTYREGDVPAGLSVRNTEVRVYHMWDESLVPIAEHDPKSRRFVFGVPCGHPPGAFDVRKYVLFNLKEGMTRPGQWYHDREAMKIRYWPLPGEDMARARIFIPLMDQVIRLDGDPGAPVSHVTLRGLVLTNANTPMRLEGFGAAGMTGALELSRTKDCRIRGLVIRNAAGYAVQARWSDGLRVEECDFTDLGAGGLRITDSTDVQVAENRFERNGFLYPCGIALWTSSGKGVTVRHNTIRDATYDGVCNGASGALFEANLIERVMLEMHDGAALYTGFCKGVTVKDNVVRDIVDTGGYGASSYYIDETGEDHLIENNLSVGVVRASHNHMAKGNIIRRNVFVNGNGELHLHFPRSRDFIVEENVLVAGQGIVFQVAQDGWRVFKGNHTDPGKGEVVREWLNDYSPLGREVLKEEDGIRIGTWGIQMGSDLDVTIPKGSPLRKLGIRYSVFKSAGCSRK